MRIIRNMGIQPSGIELVSSDCSEFVSRFTDESHKIHHLSRNTWVHPRIPESWGSRSATIHPDRHFHSSARFSEPKASLFVQSLHGAFAEHVPFSLSPDIVWYLITHEVAVHIGLNQDRYRGSFTSSEEKETIRVRDDSLVYGADNDWGSTINLFRDAMKEKVPPATIDLMLPTFTTTTAESETSLLVLFLNVLSNYYDLRCSTMCGIPTIRLEGEAEDWRMIVSQAELVNQEFSGLQEYFSDLLPVLREIAATAAGEDPDPEFWSSIYKYGGGSGGPYINGWITAFLAHITSTEGFIPRDRFDWRSSLKGWGGLTSDDFPSHVSLAPFTWEYHAKEIPMAFAAGVFGVDNDNGILAPKLGFGVLEKLNTE